MQNVLKLFYSPNQNTWRKWDLQKQDLHISDWTISFQLIQDKYIVGFALWDLSPLRFLLLGTSVWTHFSEIALLWDLAGFFCTVMTSTANIPLAFKTIITCHYLLQEQEGKSWLGFVFFYTWLCLLLLNEAKWLPVTIFKTLDQCCMT